MCGKLNIRGKVFVPGQPLSYNIRDNEQVRGRWGIGNAYNARVENAGTTWKRLSNNRGIIYVNGFYEKGKYIHQVELKLGLLYDEAYNFVILTRDAQPSIRTIHQRMPLIIDDIEAWIISGLTLPDKEFSLQVM